jgi:hypothetical protein
MLSISVSRILPFYPVPFILEISMPCFLIRPRTKGVAEIPIFPPAVGEIGLAGFDYPFTYEVSDMLLCAGGEECSPVPFFSISKKRSPTWQTSSYL